MNRKNESEETVDLAAYEPVNSEFRDHALREWRDDGKGIKMYGLPWKYVLLTIQEEERENS